MANRFDQIPLQLGQAKSTNKLKISKLMHLLDDHPYKESVQKTFKTDEKGDEFIFVDHIDTVFKHISLILSQFKRFNVKAYIKDISLLEHPKKVDGISGWPIRFNFAEYINQEGEVKKDLNAFAIHESKNAFLGQYDMTKYANRLYKDEHWELARYNIEYFRKLAQTSKRINKLRSYRLIENKNELFVRGITSINQYNEYGVDFTFVVAMLIFYQMTKDQPGNEYAISSAGISASKLEIIVSDRFPKDAGEFGRISSSTIVSTNDLGNASLKFLNIVKVGIKASNGVYLFPDSKKDHKNYLTVTHSTKIDKALENLKETSAILRSSDSFIEDLQQVKVIRTPDELRSRILYRLENRNSLFRNVETVKDLFKPKISNDISNFAKLLDMCRKAEELEIDYDLKDKLRYIISDIILNKK